jgi:hypothetical protein
MPSYRDLVLAHGAVAYWRLGETSGTTAASEVGSYPGTISGGVTLNQPGALAEGNPAIAFNGVSGKITVGAFVIALASSVEVWVRFTSAGQHTIIGCDAGVAPTTDTYGVFSGGKIYQYNGSAGIQSTGQSYNDGQWHHVVFVNTGTALSIYVDGGVTNVNAVAYARPLQSGTLSVAWATNDPNFWNGSLDEIAIYPTALTAQQVADHYAARLLLLMGLAPYAAVVVPPSGTPHTGWVPLTPSDVTDAPFSTLWIGGAGTLAAVGTDDRVVNFAGILAGTRLKIAGRRVNTTNTTATNILALQRI